MLLKKRLPMGKKLFLHLRQVTMQLSEQQEQVAVKEWLR